MQYDSQEIMDRAKQEEMPSLDDRVRYRRDQTYMTRLCVRSCSEHQRRALLAHRTQIPPESFLDSLPPELRRLAFATAYFVRLSPPCALGTHEPDLLDGLD